jgi:hypothetical protein
MAITMPPGLSRHLTVYPLIQAAQFYIAELEAAVAAQNAGGKPVEPTHPVAIEMPPSVRPGSTGYAELEDARIQISHLRAALRVARLPVAE